MVGARERTRKGGRTQTEKEELLSWPLFLETSLNNINCLLSFSEAEVVDDLATQKENDELIRIARLSWWELEGVAQYWRSGGWSKEGGVDQKERVREEERKREMYKGEVG
jgi:hypothetical protein